MDRFSKLEAAFEEAYQLDQLAERETPNRSWGMIDSMRHEANAIARQMAEERGEAC